MDDLIRDFVVETLDDLDVIDAELVRFEREPGNQTIVQKIYRLMHTIKGTCGFLALHRLEKLSHAAEGVIDRFRTGAAVDRDDVTLVLTTLDRVKTILATLAATQQEPEGNDSELIGRLQAALAQPATAPAATPPAGTITIDALAPEPEEQQAGPGEPSVVRETVRVGVERLENLMAVVSELVLVRNQLLEISRHTNYATFKLPIQRLSQITGELQDGVMRTRMQPLSGAWVKLSRVVRDIARELGKDIRIHTEGANTEIDRQILDVVKDCIVHLVRNAADHGIETAEERVLRGKPRTGSILLKASQQAGHIVLAVSDDGRGLDLALVRHKAQQQGLRSAEALAQMSDADIARLIFEPGFSTATHVTSMSGRGMGMDAVRTAITQLGGHADIINRPGAGMTILIKLPLTLAIAPVLILEAGGQRYALPQIVIGELVKAQPGTETRIEILGGMPMLRMHDSLLPLIDLVVEFGLDACSTASTRLVVICHAGASRFGLLVDAVHHTEETVVKPLPAKLKSIGYFSGATILGDGSVVLILEASMFAARARIPTDAVLPEDAPLPLPHGPDKTQLLIYRAGSGRTRMVPLASITRLEDFDAARIERSGNGYLMQYCGRLTPLRPGSRDFQLRPPGEPQPALMFSHGGRCIGLLVDEIVDVVETAYAIDVATGEPGYLGSALVHGEPMDVLDVMGLFTTSEGQLPPIVEGGVLLVTASEFFRALLTPLLNSEGFQMVTARDLTEARQMIGQQGFRAIVFDLDGAEDDVLAYARDLGARQPMRIIGMATSCSRPLVERGRAAGLAEVVGKFDRRALLGALSRGMAARELAA